MEKKPDMKINYTVALSDVGRLIAADTLIAYDLHISYVTRDLVRVTFTNR